ncbi:penicillin-binding protein [Salmonella enterica subsp. enterica]|uniref:Penicillin-binding protein n=1 Tax=Salmonella enterica I TaxID=59201 RepID=A0A3S4HVN0_SALET|nr:penicillin-binding protein [Salmonella enterica subsp. enterica]
MVATLKKSGVTQIDGNVLIDTSIFASHDKAPGWPWNDLTQCFSAPPAAAIVDRNCFSVSLYSAQKPNDLAFIRVASYYPVNDVQPGTDSTARFGRRAVLRVGCWCLAI